MQEHEWDFVINFLPFPFKNNSGTLNLFNV